MRTTHQLIPIGGLIATMAVAAYMVVQLDGQAAAAAGDYTNAATAQVRKCAVTNLQPGASFTFVIDGTEVATATTDRRGRAEVELNVRIPGRE